MKHRLSVFVALLAAVLAVSVGCAKTPSGGGGTLALGKARIELFVGGTEQIVDAGGKAIDGAFLSTSPQFVSVADNGVVTAVAVGASVIVVRKGKSSGVCTVVVTGDAPIDLTELKIDGGPQTLTAGQSVTLTYTKTPASADNYNSLRWSSDAPAIASVDENGILTAKKPGSARITLSATGTEFSDSFELTVEARPSTLTPTYADVTGLAHTETPFDATLFTDYDDAGAIAWTSTDDAVAAVADGVLRFGEAGTAIVTCTATAGGETLTATAAVRVVDKPGYTVIRTPKELQDVSDPHGLYMLGNDIDLAAACAEGGELWHNGAGFTALFSAANAPFRGTFDGMGYAIRNLTMKTATAFTALFAHVSCVDGSSAVIRDLALIGGRIEGGGYTAPLVGRCATTDGSADAVVEDVLVSGVAVTSSFGAVAGLIGFNGGLVRRCAVDCVLTAPRTASIALRQCDYDGIGISECIVREGVADAFVPDGASFAASVSATVADAAKWIAADTFDGWEHWTVGPDGPRLRTARDAAEVRA